MVDGGVENFNEAVDELVGEGLLRRILAQTDIAASNSMVEAFFRSHRDASRLRQGNFMARQRMAVLYDVSMRDEISSR